MDTLWNWPSSCTNYVFCILQKVGVEVQVPISCPYSLCSRFSKSIFYDFERCIDIYEGL